MGIAISMLSNWYWQKHVKVTSLLLGITLIAAVQIRAQPEPQFFYSELFGMEEGMDHGVIGDFQSDKNGMIWIRTINNLQLFDGHHFIDMDAHLNAPYIDGEFNYMSEDGLYMVNDHRVVKFDTDTYRPERRKECFLPALPDSGSLHILLEDLGFLYVGHPNDTVYRVDKALMKATPLFKLPIPPYWNRVYSDIHYSKAEKEAIGYINKEGLYTEVNMETGTSHIRNEIVPFPLSTLRIGHDTLYALGIDSLFCYAGKNIFKYPLPAPIQGGYGFYLLLLPGQKIMVALRNRVFEFNIRDGSWSAEYKKIGNHNLFEIKIRSMEHDPDGNLYIADLNRGLIKLYPQNGKFDFIGSYSSGSDFTRAVNVSEKNNVVLMGTLVDGLMVFDTLGNLLKHYLRSPEAPTFAYIHYILKLNEDHFLIFSDRLFEFTIRDGEFQLKESSISLRCGFYPDGFEFPQSNLFVLNTGYDLLKFSPGQDFNLEIFPEDINHTCLTNTFYKGSILTAITNRMYMTDVKTGKVTHHYKIPYFGYSRALAPYDENHILLGTDFGLYLLEIAADTAIVQKRLYDKLVYSLLPGNEKGEFWFGTDYGLFRLNAKFQLDNFSKEDGLQDNEFNTNSCYKSASGKLYFGGVNGITAFYPSELNASVDPIEEYVSNLSSNHRPLATYSTFDTTGRFELSYNESNIEIELLGKGGRAPTSYNYQYKMDGLNSQWINLGNQTNVNFHLAPGHYHFYYHIGSSFDPNVTPSRGFTIFIKSPFYLRWWFVSSAILAVVGAGFYLLLQRKKKQALKLKYEFQLNEKLQKERMRISRELHDNIGAQMATVKRNINFLVSHHDHLGREQVESKMKDLENISTQINQELRDTIWATQSEHISVQDFIARIKSYVFQTLGHDGWIRVNYEERCDKEVILGPLLALNLHRICQETLNNAFKHSGASELTIIFEGNHDFFKVTIRDNGSGFDIDSIHQGYGLGNIRHRSAQIGASLIFNRGIEQGSSLEITIENLDTSNKPLDK